MRHDEPPTSIPPHPASTDLAVASNTTIKIAGIALDDHDNIKITTMFSVKNDPHLITSKEISKSFIEISGSVQTNIPLTFSDDDLKNFDSKAMLVTFWKIINAGTLPEGQYKATWIGGGFQSSNVAFTVDRPALNKTRSKGNMKLFPAKPKGETPR
jgi:hypothetical protein